MDGYRKIARDKATNRVGPEANEVLLAKARHIKLLLLDVDGVLTDGTLLYTSSGEECKPFNTQDGFGISLLHKAGLASGIITARQSAMVKRRAAELQMEYVHQGTRKKLEAYRQIVRTSGLKPIEIAYMGDDWLDLVLLQQVGLAITPADGALELRDTAHYVTPRNGGHGAVRDACNLILEAQGKLAGLLKEYTHG